MKVFELRAFLKERGFRGFSTMQKSELEAKVREIKEKEKAEKYEKILEIQPYAQLVWVNKEFSAK